MLLFLLLNPEIKKSESVFENPKIVIAVDNSSSMKNDIKKINSLISVWSTKLEENFDLKLLQFDRNTRIGIDSLDASGKRTNLSQCLSTSETLFGEEKIEGFVLLSDGIINDGQNPRYLLPKIKFPIYCVMFGDTSQKLDLKIEGIRHNEVNRKGDYTPIYVDISCIGAKSENFKVSIFSDGKLLKQKSIHIEEKRFFATKIFYIKLPKNGLNRISVNLSSLKNEHNVYNNQKTIFIDQVDKKVKVAVETDAPHPDINALKQAINGLANLQWTANKDSADIFVFHLNKLTDSNTKKLQALQDKNTPCLFILGNQSQNWPQNILTLSESKLSYSQSESYLNPKFSPFAIPEKKLSFLYGLPPLENSKWTMKNENTSNALLNKMFGNIQSNIPQIFFQELAGKRNVFVFGTGIWRWRFYSYKEFNSHEEFDWLIEKIFLYLTSGATNNEDLISPDKKVFKEFEDVRFSGIYRDKTNQLSTRQNLSVEIINANGFQAQKTMIPRGYQFHTNFKKLSPGDYNYQIIESKEIIKKGSFAVSENRIEENNSSANHKLLRYLSQTTNAAYFLPNQSNMILEILKNKHIQKKIYFRERHQSILSIFYFLIITTLLTTEWYLRKYFGRL
tara:strand:+ start:1862 stop:3721 length:1860 start_codon:yes stop_codon:yes gene_type:complete